LVNVWQPVFRTCVSSAFAEILGSSTAIGSGVIALTTEAPIMI
jgi:hypothetical protein